jgi:HPt (histidine-containing phosphotransfer) domain-containing protein
MGGAAFLGADTLRARCAQIERLADAGELDGLMPHLAALRLELERTLAEISPDMATSGAMEMRAGE